jgi:hypothetical protein
MQGDPQKSMFLTFSDAHGWTHGWTDACMVEWMDDWIHEWMIDWTDEWSNAFINECNYQYINKLMNEQCCRAHIQALERSARAGEAECEAAVARRADIAKQQVTAWQAAAQATAQLQTAQQQKAAKAAKQAQKVKEQHFFITSARNLTGVRSKTVIRAPCCLNLAMKLKERSHFCTPRHFSHWVEIAFTEQQKSPFQYRHVHTCKPECRSIC